MNELGNQFASAVLVSQILEVLKNSNWFGLFTPKTSVRVKYIIGIAAAIITSLGISYTFDYTAANGGTVILHLPAFHVLFDAAKQWAFQEFVYKAGIKDQTVVVNHTVNSLPLEAK